MITLRSDLEGSLFVLRVDGYEQPEETGDEWDDNWLIVSGSALTRDFPLWTYRDPCLSTWDLPELAEWLESAARGVLPPRAVTSGAQWATPEQLADEGWLAFVEPCLAFLAVETTPTAVHIVVRMSEEVSPPTAEESELVHLVVSPEQVRQAAHDAFRAAVRYPRRGPSRADA